MAATHSNSHQWRKTPAFVPLTQAVTRSSENYTHVLPIKRHSSVATTLIIKNKTVVSYIKWQVSFDAILLKKNLNP